jgi:hypothetical protein
MVDKNNIILIKKIMKLFDQMKLNFPKI